MSKEMATVEQIKSGLIDKIHSIKNREFLEVLDRLITNNATAMENSKKISIEELPREIVELLNMSDSEKLEDCIEHTTSRDILNNK